MATVRAVLILLVLVAVSPPLMLLQWVFTKLSPSLARRLPVLFHRGVARLLDLRINVRGAPLMQGPALIAANHSSWLDIIVISTVGPVSFVSKREVARWPVFGTFARLQRTVFVDRDKRAATGAYRKEMQERFSQGDILVLFPEGTSTDGNRILPFKSALMGAAEMEVADRPVHVQPMTVAYGRIHAIPVGREGRPRLAWYGNMDLVPHLWEILKLGPIDVDVILHQPVTIDMAGGRKELARQCEEIVRHGLLEIILGRPRRKAASGTIDAEFTA